MEVVRRPSLVCVMVCKPCLAVERRARRSAWISLSCFCMWRSCLQQLLLKLFKLFRSKSLSFLTLWRCIKNPPAVLDTLFRNRLAFWWLSDSSFLNLTTLRWRALMSRAWVFVFMIINVFGSSRAFKWKKSWFIYFWFNFSFRCNSIFGSDTWSGGYSSYKWIIYRLLDWLI